MKHPISTAVAPDSPLEVALVEIRSDTKADSEFRI